MTRRRDGGHRPRERNATRRPRPERAARVPATLDIDAIAAGGSGVGRVDGMACFVPRTAPGDRVQASLTMRGRYAEGELLQVLEPSSVRVEPRCKHYTGDRCGGCQLQHLGDEAQQDARAGIVRDALSRIARRDVAAPPVHGAASRWHYRRRLTLTLERRGSRWIGGLHPYDAPNRVFALDECPITRDVLVSSWRELRALLPGLPHVPDRSGKPGSTASLRLAFRELEDGTVAVVVIGNASWPDGTSWGAAVLERVATVREVWWQADREFTLLARRVAGDAATESYADDALAFVQVNREVAAMLRSRVVEQLIGMSPRHVVEAYAGSGLLTQALAERGISVHAIEIDAEATRRARSRVAQHAHATVTTAPVEIALTNDIASGADAIVVNPPRRGLEPGVDAVLEHAAASGARLLVYISCDPATLARDLARLPSWRIAHLDCFDMFPQTAHVETVCVLVPEQA